LSQKVVLDNDVSLIRTHLSLVEHALREVYTGNLTAIQKHNRAFCLDMLHNYWVKGIFPKNLHHPMRTPYFIDAFGTACAVGQLIIETGHRDLAVKIATENNNAFIEDMQYPEVFSWANENGFTLSELEWIQPTYSICDTLCRYPLTISTISGFPPFKYLWNNSLATKTILTCPGNYYSCIVTDSLGDTIKASGCFMSFGVNVISDTNGFFVPPSQGFNTNITYTKDDGTCNGTATVNITSGNPASVYDYSWSPGNQTTQTATGLCQGQYIVITRTGNWCLRSDTVVIPSSVGLLSGSDRKAFRITPNPFHTAATFTLNYEFESGVFQIYDLKGRKINEAFFNSVETTIYRENLNEGIYIVKFTDNLGNMTIGKFIIQ
jgi:hypothetical protein